MTRIIDVAEDEHYGHPLDEYYLDPFALEDLVCGDEDNFFCERILLAVDQEEQELYRTLRVR